MVVFPSFFRGGDFSNVWKSTSGITRPDFLFCRDPYGRASPGGCRAHDFLYAPAVRFACGPGCKCL
jgi:hypothetical protein